MPLGFISQSYSKGTAFRTEVGERQGDSNINSRHRKQFNSIAHRKSMRAVEKRDRTEQRVQQQEERGKV